MSLRRLAAVVTVPLTLTLAACGGGAPETEPVGASAAPHEYDTLGHDELVAAAEEEGEVSV